MDFSKFRESGDLSDIVVETGGTEFRLHKFPLFAKSEYFSKLARNSGATDCNRVELADFPGGPEIFSIVADFCYNMKIDLTKNNVVQLRCASEYLMMSGPGNLIEVSDKFLSDTITSAKLSRSTGAVASLLLYSATIGPLAEAADIVDACVDAMVDCWLKPPTKFSSPPNSKKPGVVVPDKRDDKTLRGLCNLPLEWIVKLLVAGRENGIKVSILADLATRYISFVMERDDSSEKQATLVGQDSGTKPSNDSTENGNGNSLKDGGLFKGSKTVDIGQIFDTVLLELPESAFGDEIMTIDWITKVFKIATARNCRCKRHLVKAAGEIMNKLQADDLCIISPSLLKDIVTESCDEEDEREKGCRIIDTYMSEMVRKGVLTAETYRLLGSALPEGARKNHDKLYHVLDYVLEAEKDKLTAEQRKELIGTVNFTLLSESTLRQALDSDIIPPVHVAKGALSLCTRLRAELESTKAMAAKQEEELKRYNFIYKRGTVTSTPNPRSYLHLSSHQSSSHRHTTSADSDFEPTKESSEDPLKVLNNMLHIDRPIEEHDVISSARSKLATSVANSNLSHEPYNTFRPLPSGEHDISFEDELEFKYDRAFRAIDNSRTKPRHTSGYGYRSSFRY